MPRGRHRHSPPLHRLLPPTAIAGVSLVCALGPWLFTAPGALRVLAAIAAATATVGAAVMRRWDVEAGKRVADLTRARAGDEWRHEEQIAELETDLEESRELRQKLEHKLRAKRAELQGLRNEHAALLRRYATAETERASALEGQRKLAIEATALEPARVALPAALGPAKGAAAASPTVPAPASSKEDEPPADPDADADIDDSAEPEGPEAAVEDAGDAEAVEEKSAIPSVFSPTGSSLFLRANLALERIIKDRDATKTATEAAAPATENDSQGGPVAAGAPWGESAAEGASPGGSVAGGALQGESVAGGASEGEFVAQGALRGEFVAGDVSRGESVAKGAPWGESVAEGVSPGGSVAGGASQGESVTGGVFQESVAEGASRGESMAGRVSQSESGTDGVSHGEPDAEDASQGEPVAEAVAKGESPVEGAPKSEAREGGAPENGSPKGGSPKGGGPDGGSGKAGSGGASAPEEGEAEGKPEAVGGHERAAAVPAAEAPAAPEPVQKAEPTGPADDEPYAQPSPAAHPVPRPALPAQQSSGHYTVPTAVAVVPATPRRRPAIEGGFDFFGTQKNDAAIESVQNEDLADIVGQEALAVHKAESEAQFKHADEESRGVGQVIDLTAHDETERIDVQGLRTAAS
ncbi:hypothetical protein [Streptomyces sp. NPDC002845]